MVLSFAVTLSTADNCAAITIDDFSVGSITVSRTGSEPGESLQTSLDEAHVLGGQRGILVGEFGLATQTATIDAALSQLVFSVQDDATGYVELTYGSDEQPLNVDLTADGSDAFQLRFQEFTPAIPAFFLRVQSLAGSDAASRHSSGVTTVVTDDGGAILRFPFSIFDEADLTSVERIVLDFHRFSSPGHFTLTHFGTVPEPTSGALVVLGACILTSTSRRRVNR